MEKVQVLDHGYLQLVESWGSDERIIEAARMSTGKGFLGWGGFPCGPCQEANRLDPSDNGFRDLYAKQQAEEFCVCRGTGKTTGDEKLLRYLWEHKHATPFEMAGMTIEVQAPIFVFREWRTHRTCAQAADEYTFDDCFPGDSSYNEMSSRYTPLPDVNYIPTVERLLMNAGASNKQASAADGAEILTEREANDYRAWLSRHYELDQQLYEQSLKIGVPKELARVHIPVGRYSRMRASANLRNWLGFLTLRIPPDAQWEIQRYAHAVAGLLRKLFPRTMELFDEGRQG